mmetsp:Transcript_122088/g.352888  ORF Transcript_122088/g.352888 Transcript_122088/m.352888 type:complete len:210 (+) Transcript_122088:1717-2346(+)
MRHPRGEPRESYRQEPGRGQAARRGQLEQDVVRAHRHHHHSHAVAVGGGGVWHELRRRGRHAEHSRVGDAERVRSLLARLRGVLVDQLRLRRMAVLPEPPRRPPTPARPQRGRAPKRRQAAAPRIQGRRGDAFADAAGDREPGLGEPRRAHALRPHAPHRCLDLQQARRPWRQELGRRASRRARAVSRRSRPPLPLAHLEEGGTSGRAA